MDFIAKWAWKAPSESGALRNLTADEQTQAREFMSCLRTSALEQACEPLFRGETFCGIMKRFFKDGVSNPLGEKEISNIAAALFYFGDKGKHCWNKDILPSTHMRLLESINEDGSETITLLVLRIGEILSMKKKRIKNFAAANEQFYKAFVENTDETIKVLAGISDDADKRRVRDFLVFFLHNFSSAVNITPFVSCSPSFETAMHFASARAKETDHPCVLAIFLPKCLKNKVARTQNIEKNKGDLALWGIPVNSVIEDKHDEIAFFGAVFPQYIYSLFDLKNEIVIWNPAALRSGSPSKDYTWEWGLEIDQTEFNARLRGTEFRIGIERLPDADGEISNG